MDGADRARQLPVVIAGAGPAGLVTAVTLARNGIGSLLVERNPGLSPLPRATAVSTRTMELLRSWGLEDEVRAGQLDIDAVGAWTAETLASPDGAVMPLGIAGLEQAAVASPTTPAGVPQDHLEPVLLRHLRSFGLAEVRFGTELVALTQDADGVAVALREVATGRGWTVRAGHVVGADGAHSRVRSLLGIAMDGPDHLNDQLTVLFEAPLGKVVGDRRYGIYFVQHPEAGGVLVPNGQGNRWLYGRGWDPAHERLEDYTDARLTGLIRTAAGVVDLPVRPVAKGAFSFAAQVARRYREGHAFLAGDGAQRMTPRGGMGMNTAVAEGHDLGWKLAWVLRGWAGPDLLDTYEAEWRPVGARRTARSADPSPEASGAEALAEDLNGRLPHAWLSHGEGRSSTLDLLGPGLTLLTGPAGRAWSEAAKAAATPFPLEVAVLDRAAAHAVGIGPGGAVLVRPDAQMVACWPTAGAPGAELAEGLSSWFGRRPTAADEDRQVTLIVEQLAVAALDADLHEPGPLARPTTSRPGMTGSLVTWGCGRRPTRAPGSRRPRPGRRARGTRPSACRAHRMRQPRLSTAQGRSSRSAPELGEDAGGVAVGLDVVPGPFDPAVLVEEEGGAQDADRGAAVAGLLPPGAPAVHDGVVGVGQEGEAQAVLVAEPLVAGGVVGGDADHRDAGGLEAGQVVVELAGLLGAARGVVGRVEVDEHLAALEVVQRHRVAVLVGQGERRRLGALFELGHRGPPRAVRTLDCTARRPPGRRRPPGCRARPGRPGSPHRPGRRRPAG